MVYWCFIDLEVNFSFTDDGESVFGISTKRLLGSYLSKPPTYLYKEFNSVEHTNS